ncbi:MAG: hypothetical protein LBO73_03230 [Holosporaceae bacterium]|jgi:F0F1-type ATP synthase membrane subunit b/b'|nr:hypothetical protein [Holosporaceae bacterium]
MNIDPGVSIVVSFLGFAWVFMRKISPSVLKMLDGHIETVKNKISEAEILKEEATLELKEARARKNEAEKIMKEERLESEKRTERLYVEHEKYLRELREKFEAALKIRLESELARQKSQIMAKLSDEIVQKLSERIKSEDCAADFTEEDLRKLI